MNKEVNNTYVHTYIYIKHLRKTLPYATQTLIQ